MAETVWSIAELNRYIKDRLDTDRYLKNILVQGEISNLNMHSSGHWYFTLKDERCRLACVMFASYASRNRLIPANGMRVIVKGSVSVFESAGAYQLYAVSVVSDGIGDLYVQLEALRQKLEEEGLFRPEHKQPLPAYPFRIAVVCGQNTAAYQDIIRTIARRWPAAAVLPFFSLVQGKAASAELVKAIRQADAAAADVIIIARGGGSLEDLWCFNDEAVVRTVYACVTPVVSGIGHETDTTLTDYTADLRASTPTAAAESATPNLAAELNRLESIRQQLTDLAQELLRRPYLELDLAGEKLSQYAKDIQIRSQGLELLDQRLTGLAAALGARERSELKNTLFRLEAAAGSQLTAHSHQIELILQALQAGAARRQETERQRIASYSKLLDAYSPLKVLSRGYSVTTGADGRLIDSVNSVMSGQEIETRVADGMITSIVKERKPKNA